MSSLKNTISYSERIRLLKKLKQEIKNQEEDIYKALFLDFKKPPMETFLTEIHVVLSDIDLYLKNTKKWTKPKMVWPSIFNFPSKEYILYQPYGKVLVISPWNYPFQLAMCPLIAAIAAGNTVVLKPSEISYHTGQIITKILQNVFEVHQVSVVHGGAEITQQLIKDKFDYIFFTGSVAVGKIIAKAAAENLIPTTLELGGKSPCVVMGDANIALAAKKIVWGKFLNAGQTCIAPDYVLVHTKEKFNLIQAIKKEIVSTFGENPIESPDLARIINANHWDRLMRLLSNHELISFDQANALEKYLPPTLVLEPSLQSEVMQEEIFGPILPIISFSNEEEIGKIISTFEKPLAFYVFTENGTWGKSFLEKFSFGGGCINDCIMHYTNHRLPFGGIGESGIGAYHGKFGIDTFSHKKAVVQRFSWLDTPIRYAPYKKKFPWVKKILSWIG